jgi:hypothetical protein
MRKFELSSSQAQQSSRGLLRDRHENLPGFCGPTLSRTRGSFFVACQITFCRVFGKIYMSSSYAVYFA